MFSSRDRNRSSERDGSCLRGFMTPPSQPVGGRESRSPIHRYRKNPVSRFASFPGQNPENLQIQLLGIPKNSTKSTAAEFFTDDFIVETFERGGESRAPPTGPTPIDTSVTPTQPPPRPLLSLYPARPPRLAGLRLPPPSLLGRLPAVPAEPSPTDMRPRSLNRSYVFPNHGSDVKAAATWRARAITSIKNNTFVT